MPKVTQMTGRTLEGLERVWTDREETAKMLSDHLAGVGVDPDEYAAANTPDDVLRIPGLEGLAGWDKLKAKYNAENLLLCQLAWLARMNVRIATGHEPIKNLRS